MASATVDPATGALEGADVVRVERTVADLAGVFADEGARAALAQDQLVYRVEMHSAAGEGSPGGLLFGTSYISPGLVGDEYFMTKGHFHSRREAGEYYWGISGEGALILMDEGRTTWAEWVSAGSLHYIPGHTAHRLVNTGERVLAVGACWPADAGHDYDSIATAGFGARMRCVDGAPRLVDL